MAKKVIIPSKAEIQSSGQENGDQAFRKSATKGRWREMTYGGALSFMRRPYSREIIDSEGARLDVVVMGIPFDQAVTYRPGARLGPRAIRAASVQLAELKAFPFGFDPFEYLNVADWGDVFLDGGHPELMTDTVIEALQPLLNARVKTLALGGDHFVTWPLIKAWHEQLGKPLALIHFDAHCDTWEDDGTRLDHGVMFARAAKLGIVDPAHSVQIGLRTWNDDDYGFLSLTAPQCHQLTVETIIATIRQRVGDYPCYLTFDIDCLDPAFAPGTGTPVPGGLSSAQALAIIRGLGGLNYCGMDVVEVSPPFDHAEITALAAAHIAHDLLCLLAVAKRSQQS